MTKLNFNELYNGNIKKEYLDSQDYNESTHVIYFTNFKSFTDTEKQLNKDVYEMSLSEIESMFYNLRFRKESNLLNIISIIRNYTRWAYEAGYWRSNIEKFPTRVSEEYLSKFIYKENSLYLTRNQLINHLDNLVNPSMKALFLCLFEGIGGQNKYSEIRFMKKEDVFKEDDKYFVTIKGAANPKRRKLSISEKLYEYLNETIKTNSYYNDKGEVRSELVDSEYVFRTPISSRNKNNIAKLENSPVEYTYLTKRIEEFRKEIEDAGDYDKFGLSEIVESGIMHFLNEYLNTTENPELVTKEAFHHLDERFDLPKQQGIDGKLYITYKNVKPKISLSFMKSAYEKNIEYKLTKK